MNKKSFIIFLNIAVICLLTGCLSLGDIFRPTDNSPTNRDSSQREMPTEVREIGASIAVGDLTLKTTSFLNLALGYNLSIKNTTALPIEKGVCKYSIKLKDGNSIFTNSVDMSQVITKDNTVNIFLPGDILFSNIYRIVTDLKQRDSVEVILDGAVNLSSGALSKSYNFNKSGVIPVPKSPKITAGKFVVTNLDFLSAEFGFEILVENPNSFAIQTTPYYSVNFDTNSIVSAGSAEGLTAQPGTVTKTVIPLKVNFMTLAASLLSKKAFNVNFTGGMNYDSYAGKEDGKVSITDAFKIPQFPSVRLVDVPVKSTVLPPSLKVSVVMEFTNTNGFAMDIPGMSLKLRSDGKEIIALSSKQALHLDGLGKGNITIPIELDPKKFLSGLAGKFSVSLDTEIKSLIGAGIVSNHYELKL